MEAAKAIIGGRLPVRHKTLVKVALDKALETWPRIAAIYALGFSDNSSVTVELRRILADRSDDPGVRAYAAEALGNLRDKNGIRLLHDILQEKPPAELRDSCAYALEELNA
jgi:HEAT repeat protein